MAYLAIFIGGGLGSLLRFSLSILFKKTNFYHLPLGTFVSNITASLFLGLIVGYFLSKNIENSVLKNFLIVGFCGGFSTFSSFALESHMYIEQNEFVLLGFYIIASVLLSVLAIFIGVRLFGLLI